MKKKRLYYVISIIVTLPLALVGASQQSLVIGGFFGVLLALSVDELVATFKNTSKVGSK